MIGDLEMHMVAGSGHWTQQERPQEVNRLILDWLDRRFPK
jgi:pimeloyl-ACP methyl ester carboxylesterase